MTAIMIFSSCSKDDAEKMECERDNVGYITITNTSDNPYNVYLDNTYVFKLQGNTFKDDYAVSAGSHTFKAEQVSGYVLYPTVKEGTLTVAQCDKISWVFP